MRNGMKKKGLRPPVAPEGSFLHASSFYWNSKLSNERKQEIMDWANSLTPAQKMMIVDLRADSYEEAAFNCSDSDS